MERLWEFIQQLKTLLLAFIRGKSPVTEDDIASELMKPQYTKMWTDTERWSLGPVDTMSKALNPDFDLGYGVYYQDPMHYVTWILESKYRHEVIKRMLEAGCKILTEDNIEEREDITRVWGDRKHEFVLREKPNEIKSNEFDYTLVHKSTRLSVPPRIPLDTSEELYKKAQLKITKDIKKMIDAGMEIVDQWETVASHSQYKHFETFATQHNRYCLGPVSRVFEIAEPDYTEKYGVYRIHPLEYVALIGFESDILRATIRRMLKVGSTILTQSEIQHYKDITRLWGDRKHEFKLRRKSAPKHEHEYDIVYKSLNRTTLPRFEESKRTEIIKNMINAGVEIVDIR